MEQRNRPVEWAPPRRLTPAADVRASADDSGFILLNMRDGRLYASNAAGSRIWTGLQNGQSVEAIAAALGDDFGLPRERILADTCAFLSELQRLGLVAEA